MKKHSKFLVLLLSVMMVFTLIPTTAFAEGDGSAVTPELVSETLWAGTESWSSPHFSNIDANDIDVISVSSSDTGILNVECYGDSTNILSYILFPGDPGTAVITVNFMLGEEEYTVSGEYTVKAFPVFLSSLYIDGEAISAEDYNYHNFYDIEDYEGTSPNVQFTVAEGWNFDNAYYNRSLNNGNFEEIFLGENLPEEGWTFDFSDDYNKLNTFYVFRSDEGEKIQFGIRFTKSEGGVDPGDETVLDTIEITNINTELIPGKKAEFTAELLSDNMTIVNERWFRTDQGKILTGGLDDLPEVGEEYIYFITVGANEGYTFADDPTVKYNGEVVDADIHVDSETELSITGVIPNVTVTEQEIIAVYERATPFEVIMERDFKDYGDGLQYYGKTIDYPDAGDRVTFTFPDGTVKEYLYERSKYSNGKFVNVEDSTDVINYSDIYINIYNQSDEWEPGGDKNYYEVTFINYPEDASEWIICRVPIEVSSTPVASVEYEPVPVLLWANDAGRSGMPAGSKVTVTYKDGTSEVFVDDYETHSWISQETNEPIPANDNLYYEIWIEQDREELSCTASYMGVTSEKNYGAIYVAQSISLYQEKPMVLKKGKNSTTKTDAAGNEYEEYELYKYDWFGENDVLTVTYKNGMGDTIDVDYVTDSETSFGLAEDSPYYSGYPDDHLSANYITIHMPDQSENHFETGQTYSMDMTYHVVGSNFELPAFTTEGEPYKVLISEAGSEDVTRVYFEDMSNIRIANGETAQLEVKWEPANVTDVDIEWTSTHPEVATVDENGLVTANLQNGKTYGDTQITAKIGNHTTYPKNVIVYTKTEFTDQNVNLVGNTAFYTGEPRTFNVRCGSNILTEGTDYEAVYSNNTYIGDASVTITGKGDYKGTVTKTFKIVGRVEDEITQFTVEHEPIGEYTYSGEAFTPAITSVSAVGKGTSEVVPLVEGEDYEVIYNSNINAGTGRVMVSGLGYYFGGKTFTFTINPLEITPEVTLDTTSYTYDGNAKEPAVTVKHGDKTLTKDKDYTVEYKNNVNAGTATAAVTMKGNYSGYAEVDYTIAKATQKITGPAATYKKTNGNAAFTLGAKTSGDGKLTYSSSKTTVATVSTAGKVTIKGVGTATITITAAETTNYKKATKKVTINVVPAATTSLTAANQATGIKLTWKKVTGATGYKVYRGTTLLKKITSGSTVTYTDTKANTNGTKYTFKVVPYASTGDGTSKSLTTYRVSRPAISSATNSAAGKATIKWGKNAKATGYEIWYSTSSSFSTKKTKAITKYTTVSTTLSSLTKGKTYYVKIRTYKTVSGKKYYSAWSVVKTVKITK